MKTRAVRDAVFAWLDQRPEGGCCEDIAPLLKISILHASDCFRRLGMAGRVVWVPEPKGKANLRRRYFTMRHKPAVVGAAAKVKREAAAPLRINFKGAKLDGQQQETRPEGVKVTRCPHFEDRRFRPDNVTPFFSALKPGQYPL
jgi:hypothetical protein